MDMPPPSVPSFLESIPMDTTLAVITTPQENLPPPVDVTVTPTMGENSSSMPQWLIDQTPRKRKVVVPLPTFDFSSLKVTPAKSAKKPKMVSRVSVDASGHKFAEIATPTAEKTKNDIMVTDYQITRVDLGKVTMEGSQQDAQDAMNVLCQKLKETKASKDELKEK
ncbi:hypothetical protein KI387_027052, partial [Taxus chinensis]